MIRHDLQVTFGVSALTKSNPLTRLGAELDEKLAPIIDAGGFVDWSTLELDDRVFLQMSYSLDMRLHCRNFTAKVTAYAPAVDDE